MMGAETATATKTVTVTARIMMVVSKLTMAL